MSGAGWGTRDRDLGSGVEARPKARRGPGVSSAVAESAASGVAADDSKLSCEGRGDTRPPPPPPEKPSGAAERRSGARRRSDGGAVGTAGRERPGGGGRGARG